MPPIKVAIRIRPEQDSLIEDFSCTEGDGIIRITVLGQKHEFNFEQVFNGDASQEEVFNRCAVPVCRDVIQGFNGSILAYGQTGAGKTHTMSGSQELSDYNRDRGLCMRTASHLFELARRSPDSISIRLSVLEVHNENLIDLLREPTKHNTNHIQGSAIGGEIHPAAAPLTTTIPKLNI